MADPVAACPTFNPNTDCPRKNFTSLTCDQLSICMNHLVNAQRSSAKSGVKGLKDRFDEQTHGPCGPATDTWKNHDNEIKGAQDKLTDYAEFYRQNCGEPSDEILEWATKPRPQPGDWAPVPGEICEELAAKAAAAAAAAAAAQAAAKAAAEQAAKQAAAEAAEETAAEAAAETAAEEGAGEVLLELLPLLLL